MDYFINVGRYFGYPDCCIQDFLKRIEIIKAMRKQGLRPGRPNRKLQGTGYVPCPECNKLDEKTLIANIKANRAHPEPFPNDGRRMM